MFFSTNFRKDSRSSCLPLSMRVSSSSVAIFFLVLALISSFITLYFSDSSMISRNSSSVTLLSLKGLLQCKVFIGKSDKTLPENANKKHLSVLRCIYPEKLRIKHQICTCPKIDNQKNRKNQLVCVTSRMCTATIHIRTSVQLVWNVYRFKPLYYITITLCTAEFETLYIIYILPQRQK